MIDWNLPALQIARLVRASAEPFAGAFSYLGTHRLQVWRASAIERESPMLGVPGQVSGIDGTTGVVQILCGEGILEIERVSLDEGDRVAPGSLIRSTRQRLGLDLVATVAALQARLAVLEAENVRSASLL